MARPLRIGVMQLTMEPLEEMLESARVMDRVGMDTIWLAEAYPWWRKHGMEARSSTVTSALIARETERLAVGWGIISPFTRHPVQVAMDARVVQEAAGPDRFLLGFGTSKIFLNNARLNGKRTLGPMREAVDIVRGVLAGGAFQYDGETFSADVPALQDAAETPRDVPPVYVAATAPKMQQLAGEIAEGCLTPSITTPAFVRYTRENVGPDIDVGCTVVASIHASDRDAGRDGAREIAGMYLANKVQNIKGAADRLVALAVDLVSVPSPTGDEQGMGERVREEFEDLGLQVQWQQVEDGRPNVVGLMEGAGGAPSLMFNGHMDTSYSGQEPWLAGIRGFQPEGFVQEGRVYGLGISNMKGALACYMAAVRALRDAGVRLRGDVMVACVAGEIEKTQWHPDFVGSEYRGYASGSRFLTSHGAVTDMCILGEPTEQRIVLGHYGSLWMRISTSGPFIHTAFSEGRRNETSIVRMRDVLDAVLEYAPEWEEWTSYGGKKGIVNVGAINGGFAWRVSPTPE